jgi:hypothetical protein
MHLPEGILFRLRHSLRFLSIVRMLVEDGNASVNARSKSTGYTPLSNPFMYEP